MKFAFHKLTILTFSLATLVLVQPASAGFQTETQTVTFGTEALQISTPVYVPPGTTSTFAQFNSSLGTLVSVTITLNDTSTVSVTMNNLTGNSTEYFTGASATDTISVIGLDGMTTMSSNLTSNVVNNGSVAAMSSLANQGSLTGTGTSGIVNQTDLSDYIGTSTTSVLTYTGTAAGTGTILGGNNPSFGFQGSATFYGSATIVYTYSVPEPASMAMVAMGLGGLAIVARFRRRTA